MGISPEEKRARLLKVRRQIRSAISEDVPTADFEWLMKKVFTEFLQVGETLPDAAVRVWRSRYLRIPVSVREFVTGRPYLNLPIGSSGVYPKIMEALELLFDGPYSDVVLAGSIGWGKSTFGTLAVCYDLYKLSCLKDPAVTYGMKARSNITFVNISVDRRQAERVFFTDLYNLIKGSWYFNHVFPYDKSLKTEIRFPNNVHCYPVAASEQAALGVGVFCAFIDEVNYMDVIERSKRTTPGATNMYDQAEAVFNKLRARMRSRMNLQGRLPGHIYACSSARYPDDFTERLVKEARKEVEANETKKPEERKGPYTLVLSYALWETIPEGRISSKRFRVEVGDEGRRTRVLYGDEDDVNEALVIEVPEDYRRDFERDPDLALRDLAGRSVLSIRPFISRRELIQKMFELGEAAGLKHPFTKFDVTLQQKDPALERLVPENLHWIDFPKKNPQTGTPLYINKPQKERGLFPMFHHAHCDLAKSGDAAGVVIGHIVGQRKIKRFDAKRMEEVEESKPIIRVDLVLRVVAPPQGEIDIPRIRAIFYELQRAYGMQFGRITFDTYGSQESIKTMKDEGFNADLLSMDRDNTPYDILRTAIYDERILCYRVPVLEKELIQLERGDKKVDHPATHGASKDLADALAGMVYNCEESWRSGEAARGLFQPGIVVHPGQMSEHRKAEIRGMVVRGVALTDQDENDLLFGELENS